ncbi:uncharacterized protein G2W53_017996 [Senna tora]|uniref:Uncharacterized protein n=1 Tax=Senna tora TaxID=362788 RepID=A0A834TRW4_9FABA|nr:uncharacterized protein G2W53_017996 [Senna tora]
MHGSLDLDALPIPRSQCQIPWIQNFRDLDDLLIPRGLDAQPIPSSRCLGSQCPTHPQGSCCPANPQVSMPGSLDLKFQGSRCPPNTYVLMSGSLDLKFQGSRCPPNFLGFKISRISMAFQSLGLDAWGLDALPIPRGLIALPIPMFYSEGIGNSMEERIPDTIEKVSIKIALSDSVDNIIDNGGLP